MPALADEIARLSKENALLRNQIQNVKKDILIQGLTFSELKSVLAKKGLLDFLISKRLELIQGIRFIDYEKEVPELNIVGLIAYNNNYKSFILTESGSIFMNQIELEQIVSSERIEQQVYEDGV